MSVFNGLVQFLILAMLFVTIGAGSVISSAEEYFELSARNVSPRLTNCYQCIFTFQVLDPSEAHVGVTYAAKADVFTQAKLTVKIQKKFLLLFWQTVDIGTTNDEWVAYSSAINGQFYNYFPVDGTGTYRAVFSLEMSGTTGVVDVIEDTIEFKYT